MENRQKTEQNERGISMKNKVLKRQIEAEIELMDRGYSPNKMSPNEELKKGLEELSGMDIDANIFSFGTRRKYDGIALCCGVSKSNCNTFIDHHQAKQCGIPIWNKSKTKVCPQCAILARTGNNYLDEDTKKLLNKYRRAYVNWKSSKIRYEQREHDMVVQKARENNKLSCMIEIDSLSTFEEKAVYFVRVLMDEVSKDNGIHSCDTGKAGVKFGYESLPKLMMSHILNSEGRDDYGNELEEDEEIGYSESVSFKEEYLQEWLKPWLPSYIDDFKDSQHMQHAKDEIVKMYGLDTDDPITLAHDWCEDEFWSHTYPTITCVESGDEAIMITVDSTGGAVEVCSDCGCDCVGEFDYSTDKVGSIVGGEE
tara:strand:- start:41593 stop:42696 length:1104 start_codon:yes stop_codon:yes gene_type:complete